MKLCVLTGYDPTGVYMLEELGRRFSIDHIVRVIWSNRPAGPGAKTASRIRKITPSKVWSRVTGHIHDWQLTYFDRQVSRALFGTPAPPRIPADTEIKSYEINGEAAEAQLRAIAPDLLLVNGAPILKPNIFTIPRLGTINIHFGIAPAYRGTNSNFWAVYLRDFDNVGVTVHFIDKSVDGGKLLALGYPQLEPGDTEVAVKAKCARLASELVASFLEKTGGEAEGVPQETLGKLFRNRDRTPWLQLRLAIRNRVPGMQIPAVAERRVELFEAREP